MRSRSSLPDDFAAPPAAGLLAVFDAFAGRSSSRVVRCAINQLYELSILPQNEVGCLSARGPFLVAALFDVPKCGRQNMRRIYNDRTEDSSERAISSGA